MGVDGTRTMLLGRFSRLREGHRRYVILGALLSTLAGFDLLLNEPKGSGLQWFAIPFLAGGAALFAWAVWPKGVAPGALRESLASKLLHRLTLRGRLLPYLPVLGVGIVVADLVYNLTLSATPELLTEDTIVLLGGTSLVAYGFVPSRLARERDFVLVFFLALNAILVVPLLVARIFTLDFERSVDLYSWAVLAPPTSAVLNAIGVQNTVHPVVGSTAPGLTFVPQNLVVQVTVIITTACSGIYSFGIFAAAFVAFVLTQYRKPTARMWVLVGLGFLASYAANVLRMVVIVLVGYYTDTPQTDLQNMLLAHSYAGWIIFLGWIALFWFALLKVIPGEAWADDMMSESVAARRRSLCDVCHNPLTPVVPAIRCGCGIYRHRDCFGPDGSCPQCGRRAPVDHASA